LVWNRIAGGVTEISGQQPSVAAGCAGSSTNVRRFNRLKEGAASKWPVRQQRPMLQQQLKKGVGILKVAKTLGLGTGTVQRTK
jgi:hypothetical protein